MSESREARRNKIPIYIREGLDALNQPLGSVNTSADAVDSLRQGGGEKLLREGTSSLILLTKSFPYIEKPAHIRPEH